MGRAKKALQAALDLRQLGVAFIGYLVFSAFMTIGAMATTRLLFHPLAAWSELGIAILSFYGSAAAVINGQFGRVLLPLGKPFGPARG